jgi:3-methyladenine DNA glycosylase AlkD
MNLIKDHWSKKDIKEFNDYLLSIKKPEKIEFSKRVVNTNMEVLGLSCPDCKDIAKQIHCGNFYEFLEKNDFKYYESTQVSSYLINYIKDVKEKEKFINGLYMDNWATVDTLKFNIKNQEKEFLDLSKKYIKSKETFKRRVGVRILFSYTSSEYVDEIFDIMDSLNKEKEYYVNMAVAWLGCELMIKNRKKTLEYLNHHKLNDFTLNKMISKCHDSFRISDADKAYLKKLKKEN